MIEYYCVIGGTLVEVTALVVTGWMDPTVCYIVEEDSIAAAIRRNMTINAQTN